MLALASDHAGFDYKEKIKPLLDQLGVPYKDFGTTSGESTDYPDWGHLACQAITSGECDRGILICGTGIGMSIVANKHKGIRGAACESTTAARLSRQHNNANVLALGARVTGWESATDIIRVFLSTPFEGGRHERRVNKIHDLTGL
jgi:ribose 5-phosphate isomerase B